MPLAPHKISECTKFAINCFGTGSIFELRAQKLRWKTRWLTFLGIACPIAVGATAGAYSANSPATACVIGITTLISIPLAILSVWSLVAKWDDNLSYFVESKSDNYRLSTEFRRLSSDPNMNEAEFDTRFSILDAQAGIRKTADERFDFSQQEKNLGMRSGLRQYEYPCAGCKIVPRSLESTDCPICGQFKNK